MKEYSNAFLSGQHYSKFIEIFNSGVVYYDTIELEFVKILRNKYGLNVVFTSFNVNKLQTVLHIYIDFSKNDNDFISEICTAVRNNEVVNQPLNNKKFFGEKLSAFADELMDEYLNVFCYDKEKLNNFQVYVYDLQRSFLARVHNVALDDFKSVLKRKFIGSFSGINIFIDYEPSVKIVIDSFLLYEKLKFKKKMLVKELFDIIKKYDKFDLFEVRDVNLIILLEKDLSDEEKNRYSHLGLLS